MRPLHSFIIMPVAGLVCMSGCGAERRPAITAQSEVHLTTHQTARQTPMAGMIDVSAAPAGPAVSAAINPPPIIAWPAVSTALNPCPAPSPSQTRTSAAVSLRPSLIRLAYVPAPVLLKSAMKAKTNPPTTAREPVIKTDSRPMGDGPTLTGLDVLQRNDFRQLKGKRAALLTNHTAINRESVNILDLMTSHPNVKLVALFSPEHGLFGNVDTQVEDFHNTRTGLMVYSLYTARKDPNLKAHHPRPQDLKGIDVVVIDMQDIGARFYTYSGYMGNMMEECGKLGVEVMVLDRPNPIGGLYVDGPLTDDDLVGAVTSYFKMPIAHGMTMGEMAMMFNAENKLGCKLTIVQAQNWTRDMCFDQTGLRWVNPSPNIQDLDAALAYPGIAMTERNVSMGRGTTEPFHLFGTPFIDDPRGMCDEINKSGLVTGARIEAADFTPTGTLARQHIGEGKTCRGGRIIITDRRKFRPVALGVSVMTYLCAKYGEKYVPQKTSAGVKTAPQYDVMQLRGLTSAVLCARIREKVSAENNLKFIDQQVAHFLPIRAKYLLYPEKKP